MPIDEIIGWIAVAFVSVCALAITGLFFWFTSYRMKGKR